MGNAHASALQGPANGFSFITAPFLYVLLCSRPFFLSFSQMHQPRFHLRSLSRAGSSSDHLSNSPYRAYANITCLMWMAVDTLENVTVTLHTYPSQSLSLPFVSLSLVTHTVSALIVLCCPTGTELVWGDLVCVSPIPVSPENETYSHSCYQKEGSDK